MDRIYPDGLGITDTTDTLITTSYLGLEMEIDEDRLRSNFTTNFPFTIFTDVTQLSSRFE